MAKATTKMIYAQGDILIERVKDAPAASATVGNAGGGQYGIDPDGSRVLARGEVTGHRHRFAPTSDVALFRDESLARDMPASMMFHRCREATAMLADLLQEHHPDRFERDAVKTMAAEYRLPAPPAEYRLPAPPAERRDDPSEQEPLTMALPPRYRAIIREAAAEAGLSVAVMLSKRRSKDAVGARRNAIRQLSHRHGLSSTRIGRIFALDHATVLHHLQNDGWADRQ